MAVSAVKGGVGGRIMVLFLMIIDGFHFDSPLSVITHLGGEGDLAEVQRDQSWDCIHV